MEKEEYLPASSPEGHPAHTPVFHWSLGLLGLREELVESKWILLRVLLKLDGAVSDRGLVCSGESSVWLEPAPTHTLLPVAIG